MRQSEILTLFDYNYWASKRILDAASELSTDQYMAATTLALGSIHNTLVHTMSAEWVWLQRCQGVFPTNMLDADAWSTLESLRQHWIGEEQAARSFFAGLNDADMDRVVHYSTTNGAPKHDVLWQILLHVVNHGTQHRSEVAHVLTELGFSPGGIDLIGYLREQG